MTVWGHLLSLSQLVESLRWKDPIKAALIQSWEAGALVVAGHVPRKMAGEGGGGHSHNVSIHKEIVLCAQL